MDLSIIVCAFDMQRELPRTVYSLGPVYQRDIQGLQYEILVADNGSHVPVDQDALTPIAPNVRVIRTSPALQSPVRVINELAREAKGRVVGALIDGARMASPRLLHFAMMAHRADAARAIGTLGFHLGPDLQNRSIRAGYDQAVEDELLESVRWREDGYRLFDISVLAASSNEGWLGNMAESNALFADRGLWHDLGGFDERFQAPGGGLANPELWKRAVAASAARPWIILGEGTFHQVHGGAATGGDAATLKVMRDEYVRIFGAPFARPKYDARFIGALPKQSLKFLHPARQNAGRQAISVAGRSFEVAAPAELLESVQSGTLRTRYKGRRMAKNPFDLSLYLQLLQQLQPKTIIEIGALEGGSAVWFQDQCTSLGLSCQILSMDLDPPREQAGDRISFVRADASRPSDTFPHTTIAASPHPWLVIEDSAHSYAATTAVLDYFKPLLHPGDYLVVEDGIVADLPGPQYRRYQDGPNRAVRDFLLKWPDGFRIADEYCDFYGRNVTWCPNGWLVRC